MDDLQQARILIVDDQESNVLLLESLLRHAGYAHLKATTDPRHATDLYAEFQPDLVLLDLMMPYLDGYQVMDRLGPLVPEGTYLPILVLTADMTVPTRLRALAAGAKDFLVKPADLTEVTLRVRNLLETRMLHLQVQDQNRVLEDRVRERTRELEEAQMEILERLARAAEYRDDATGRHARRVGELSARTAQVLGLPYHQVELLGRAAPLHDVGKIGVPDALLLKPGPLTDKERAVLETHTTIGARILSGGRFPLLQMAEMIALSHHERWDGGWYPRGVGREEIPIEARITAAVDALDSMSHDRPYRPALSDEAVWRILWAGAGTQWDRRVIEALAASSERPREGATWLLQAR